MIIDIVNIDNDHSILANWYVILNNQSLNLINVTSHKDIPKSNYICTIPSPIIELDNLATHSIKLGDNIIKEIKNFLKNINSTSINMEESSTASSEIENINTMILTSGEYDTYTSFSEEETPNTAVKIDIVV